MIRLVAILGFFASLVAGVVFWSGGFEGQGGRADFAFVNRGDNKTLDPNQMSWMQDIRIAYALWEGLYTLDPVTMKPILGCADRAEVDPLTYNTVWTLHIRDNAKWSNGDPVLARDFLFAWRRFLETPGEYTYLHFYIKGAKAYSDAYQAYLDAKQGGSPTAVPPSFDGVGEKALDERTLQVTLTDPIPFFPALCAFTPFFPMHEPSMRAFRQVDKVTGVTHYDEQFTHPPYLVTNGPYRLKEWSFKRRLRMIASDYYWDRANVKSRVIDQIYVDDPMAQFRAYDRGEVDWLADVDPDLAAEILDQKKRTDLHVFPAFGTYFLSFNCLPKLPNGRSNPLADVRVRQALSMAIDREPIVKQVGRLGQPISRTYIPPGVFKGYLSCDGLPYDVSTAKKLLADAGYPDGKGMERLTILFNTESFHADVAQIVRRQWLNNLGIQMDLEGVEVKVFGKRLHSQEYDIARAGWFGDYDDPTTFTDKYKSDSDDNDSKWTNQEYDRLCAEAQKQTDPAARLSLLSHAESLLVADAPILPLFTYVNSYMFRDNVKGIPLAPNAMLIFKSVEVIR